MFFASTKQRIAALSFGQPDNMKITQRRLARETVALLRAQAC
jgi:hypothetical protein